MKYALYQAPDTTDVPGEIIICDADETYMGKPMDEYTKAGWKRIGCIESDMNYFGIVQGFNARWQYKRKKMSYAMFHAKEHLAEAEAIWY